jgi:hypothetical protein
MQHRVAEDDFGRMIFVNQSLFSQKQEAKNNTQNPYTKPKHKSKQPTPANKTKAKSQQQATSKETNTKTTKTTIKESKIMMTKLSSAALALVVTAASHASVSAQAPTDDSYMMGNGQFASCPNPKEFYQGFTFDGGAAIAYCTDYPGKPLSNATATAVSVSSDPGLNGWSCYPEGKAECPAGFAISEMCVSFNGGSVGGSPTCANYCTTPGFFAMKCVPNPIKDVPLNSGEWLPFTGGEYGNAMCDDGSIVCGLCYSSNPTDCQGKTYRAKCCKCCPSILPPS